MPISLRKTFLPAWKLSFSLWRNSGVFLLMLFLSWTGLHGLSQWFQTPLAADPSFFFFEATVFAFQVSLEAALFLFVPLLAFFAKVENPVLRSWRHLYENFPLIVIEFLRSLASILRWGILLIVPGLIKQWRYSFVTYIVFFDPRYEKGELDALDSSEEMVKGHTLWLGILFLVDVVVSSVVESTLKPTPQPAVFLLALSFVAFAIFKVFIYSWVYCLFRDLLNQSKAETSLEEH